MRKIMRSISPRNLFIAVCMCLLTTSAHALTLTCPAYPSNIKSTIGTGTPPAEPIVVGVTGPAAGVGTNALVCKYTLRLTQNYPPHNPISSCPSHPLVMNLVAPNPPPATGFTSWAFGPPGTPMGSSSSVSAAQSVTAIYSMTQNPPPMTGFTRNCQTSNSGVFQFQIYSNFPSKEACTASGSSFTCTAPTPPLCQPSLKGSQLPTVNWSASSSAPGYYAYQSAILNSNNGIPILTQPSLATIMSAMGSAAFSAATFTLPSGGQGSGGGLPNGVISCGYDSPQFVYQGQPATAQVTVACTNSCGSL
jgi:hypothetical protein